MFIFYYCYNYCALLIQMILSDNFELYERLKFFPSSIHIHAYIPHVYEFLEYRYNYFTRYLKKFQEDQKFDQFTYIPTSALCCNYFIIIGTHLPFRRPRTEFIDIMVYCARLLFRPQTSSGFLIFIYFFVIFLRKLFANPTQKNNWQI